MRFFLVLISVFGLTAAFHSAAPIVRQTTSLSAQDGDDAGNSFVKGFNNMFSTLDDVIDDFFNKRMGNGEVFYGKRKYKPSCRPNTEGYYNGMGISDKSKIDFARERKEERIAAKMERLERENNRQ